MKQPLPSLKRRRLILGKTQAEVAEDARMSKSAISLYELGLRRPHPHRIKYLALGLDMTPEQLVELLG